MDDKQKHLEFIQNIITRLNSNSYKIKSWCVTLVAAVLALYASTQKSDFILAGIFPTMIFWLMDAYCLKQERRFRGLYDDVAELSNNPKSIQPFDMNTDSYQGGKYSYWEILWTKTIWIVYFLLITFLIVVFLFIKYFRT